MHTLTFDAIEKGSSGNKTIWEENWLLNSLLNPWLLFLSSCSYRCISQPVWRKPDVSDLYEFCILSAGIVVNYCEKRPLNQNVFLEIFVVFFFFLIGTCTIGLWKLSKPLTNSVYNIQQLNIEANKIQESGSLPRTT